MEEWNQAADLAELRGFELGYFLVAREGGPKPVSPERNGGGEGGGQGGGDRDSVHEFPPFVECGTATTSCGAKKSRSFPRSIGRFPVIPVEACDAQDGVEDGVIDDPRAGSSDDAANFVCQRGRTNYPHNNRKDELVPDAAGGGEGGKR